MRLAVAFLYLTAWAAAQAPEMYRSLPRMIWVVDDVERVAAAWQKAGVPHDSADSPRSAEGRFKSLTAHFENVRADWIQPLSGKSVWSEFLRSRGPGVAALLYRASSAEALKTEAARMRSLGVAVLDDGSFEFAGGRKAPYLLFDTAREGKIMLGVCFDPKPEATPAKVGPRITQFALTARNLDAVSAYWEKLGFPPFTFTHGELTDKMYRGKPAAFDMRLGWQRHLKVPFEWIEPLKGPTVYDDHIAKHGEGFHHIAFDAPDMDKAIERWRALGFPVSMSGGWGEKGKPGSGRFAYHDTHAAGGIDIELLWNYRAPAGGEQ